MSAVRQRFTRDTRISKSREYSYSIMHPTLLKGKTDPVVACRVLRLTEAGITHNPL